MFFRLLDPTGPRRERGEHPFCRGGSQEIPLLAGKRKGGVGGPPGLVQAAALQGDFSDGQVCSDAGGVGLTEVQVYADHEKAVTFNATA